MRPGTLTSEMLMLGRRQFGGVDYQGQYLLTRLFSRLCVCLYYGLAVRVPRRIVYAYGAGILYCFIVAFFCVFLAGTYVDASSSGHPVGAHMGGWFPSIVDGEYSGKHQVRCPSGVKPPH
jgi:hypothetical protein